MPDAYLLAGARSPIGNLLGGLSDLSAPKIAAPVIAELLRRGKVQPGEVDEVILGQVLTAGVGQAPARQAALAAGLPSTVAALTINKVCGSGLKAVMLAAQAIRCGDARCIVAGGMESMSNAPHLLPSTRGGWKFGHRETLDSMLHDGLWCPFENAAMGNQADYIAASRAVSRQDQDVFAAESHRRASAAQTAKLFDAEIVPIVLRSRQGEIRFAADEAVRADTTSERLATLKPAFSAEGTVTAGNASKISDGAAALLVTDESFARRSPEPLKARIVACVTTGVEPKEIFIAPVSAIEQVLKKARMTIEQIDLIELNEAFAAQCLACMRPLGLNPDRVNIHGGAIALGHPIGASGARVLVTLLHALAVRGEQFGLASLCLGGGNAVAMIIERV